MLKLDSLEDILGVAFTDRDLLRLALIHSSYLNENPGSFPEPNERLEFLGDALIGLVIAQELYQRYPDCSEGALTPLRAALVRGDALARVARVLGLGEYLLMGTGEEASGGRERISNLAAAFEALVGALFLDQGYEAARAFVLRIMSDELFSIGGQGLPKNPKSALQEIVQAKGLAPPSYRIAEVAGRDHARQFTAEALVSGEVVGRGTGSRKSLAEQEAARDALNALEQGRPAL